MGKLVPQTQNSFSMDQELPLIIYIILKSESLRYFRSFINNLQGFSKTEVFGDLEEKVFMNFKVS